MGIPSLIGLGVIEWLKYWRTEWGKATDSHINYTKKEMNNNGNTVKWDSLFEPVMHYRSSDTHKENRSPDKGQDCPKGDEQGLFNIQPDQGESPVEDVNDKQQYRCG